MFLGVSTFGDLKDIDKDYCYVMQNFKPYPYKSLSIREGFTKQNNTVLGSSVKSIFGYKRRFTNESMAIVTYGDKIYVL